MNFMIQLHDQKQDPQRNSDLLKMVWCKNFSSLLLLSFIAVSLVACQNETGSLVAPPPPPAPEVIPPPPPEPEVFKKTRLGVKPPGLIAPKMDILFVVDDSYSMAQHQKNLVRNINKFVDGFAKDSSIDFHIAVTKVYDSIRYGTFVREGYSPLGELVPLVIPKKYEASYQARGRYISRGEGFSEILKATLKVGAKKWVKGDPVTGGGVGPEFEELYSPVLEVLAPQNPETMKKNKGFRRPGVPFSVVFITDAKDATPELSTGQFLAKVQSHLMHEGPNPKFLAYPVIIASDLTATSKGVDKKCLKPIGVDDKGKTIKNSKGETIYKLRRDPGAEAGGPTDLEGLARSVGGRTLDLCSQNFGTELSILGNDIRKQLLSRIEIPIRAFPDESLEVQVTYGGESLPEGKDHTVGWTTNSRRNHIVISGVDQLQAVEGAQIYVDYVPVDLSRDEKEFFGSDSSRLPEE